MLPWQDYFSFHNSSLYNQRSKSLRSKCFLGDLLYLLGRECVDALEEVVDVLFPAIVQEALAEVEGKALAVVAGHSQLTFYLTLGGIELCCA